MVHMRPFNDFEIQNLEFLVSKGVPFTQVQITETGLRKSILDATSPMRTFFVEKGIHNYELQSKGTNSKVLLDSYILTKKLIVNTKVSLYRPMTKDGDPRLWIYGLKDYTQANDIHIVLTFENHLYFVNITRINLSECCTSSISNPIQQIIESISNAENDIAQELLVRLRQFQGRYIRSDINADTAIGRKIETLLGIQMNASKLPDYKGIELKSFRSNRPSVRKTLFCQVPNWEDSKLKSASAIVQKYGYDSDGVRSYRNTINALAPNSQNLRLNVNYVRDFLELEEDVRNGTSFSKINDVVVWRLQKLHKRLLEKHHETFWIEVDTKVDEAGDEWFKLTQIEHTKNPNVGQFDILLEQGMITVDLLLGRPKFDKDGNKKSGGDAVSFKIKKNATNLLFPQSSFYSFV